MKGEYPPGATPLTAEAEEGLIPTHITLRTELNELEQANILEAATWLLTSRSRKTVVDTTYLKEANLDIPGDVRRRYIDAVRNADGNDFGPLLAFARS